MNATTLFRRDLTAVATALVLLLAAHPARGSEEGKALFQQKCASCHAMEPGKKLTVKESLTVKGTPLWFAGTKFKKEWLVQWLAKPTPLLGVAWNTVEKGTYDHPAVSPEESAKITDYLMTAVDASVEAGKAAKVPEDRSQKRKFLADAAQLFEKHQGCFSCHRYLNKRDVEIGGASAPTFVTAKDRLQADWIYAFLKNPQKYYPNTKCPIPFDKAANKFSDEDRANLAGYVAAIGEK